MSDLQLAGEESPFPEQSRLEELVHDVIRQASSKGADGVEAGVSIDAGLAVTVLNLGHHGSFSGLWLIHL